MEILFENLSIVVSYGIIIVGTMGIMALIFWASTWLLGFILKELDVHKHFVEFLFSKYRR